MMGNMIQLMTKKITMLLAVMVLSFVGQAQDIQFKVVNLPDSIKTMKLAKYFGEKLYYADTADVKNGVVHFDGTKHPSGLYALILPGPQLVQFIIDDEKVDMEIKDTKDIMGSMVVNKSKNNELFYQYVRKMTSSRVLSNKLSEGFDEITEEAEKEKIRKQLTAINDDVVKFQKELAKNNSDLFIGKMVGMSMDIKIPDAPKDENGVITDSSYLYNYNMAHYWDNVDLTDDNIVRTPAFHSRLEKYFSKAVMLQIPDSIISYTTNLVNRTSPTGTAFNYIVHFVTNKYEQSQIMGMDKVFVFMADTYYCPKDQTKAFWMNDASLTKVCERADKLRPIIVGAFAPRLILPDSTEKNWIDFYQIKSEYKILYFWDPNCGHCKKTTPKLQKLYDAKFKERGIEIYAVSKATGDDFEAWKKFIQKEQLTFTNVGLTKNVYNEAQKNARAFIPALTTIESLNYTDTYDIYSTPRIFVLDKNNKIMYKQLSISQLEEILDHEQGFDDAVKMFPKETDDEHEKENH
jgi:peroxiredoxin